MHLEANSLLLSKQSAYKKYHATETALLRLVSDLIRTSESGNLSLLSLLDMSAPFDMVYHSILLQKLTRTYGVNGVTLEWLKSYLRDRHQVVAHGGTRSTKRNLIYRVPQGSILGPILFLLCTGEINDIIKRYGLHSQCYADDCQVHSNSKPVEKERLQQMTLACIDGLSSWMASNRLKLNLDKTEFIWIASLERTSVRPIHHSLAMGCR